MKLPIYTNYQLHKEFEGEAVLIEKISDGLSFILREDPKNQIVYNWDLWLVEMEDGRRVKRKIAYKIRNVRGSLGEVSNARPPIGVDKFIRINGKPIY